MKPTPADAPNLLASKRVPLEAVLCAEELHRRPTRPPDHGAENRALVSLVRALAESPRTVFQTLAETILAVVHVGSVSISLLSEDEHHLSELALAGAWQSQPGRSTPRQGGPCGEVLDRNAPLLFRRPDRRYGHLQAMTPLAEECLIVPFYSAGHAVGTIWAIAHDALRHFDAEDLRQLQSLAGFASAAYQAQTGAAREQLRLAVKAEAAEQTGVQFETRNAQLRADDEALRRSEGSLRDFVENAAIGLHWVGPDGVIIWANQTELDLLGYTREEYFGHSVVEFYVDGPVIADILVRLTAGETLRDHEARLRCKDGSIRHFLIDSNVLVENGQFIRTRCFLRDITEHKRAQAAASESEAFNRSIVESSPDCIKVLDLQGNLLTMLNGQALLCIEDIRPYLNKPWADFWKGDDRLAAQASVVTAAAGAAGTFVGFLSTSLGEPKWWDVTVSPINGADGRPARLLAVSRDVTERKRAEMNLQFLDSVSVDLVHWSNIEEMTRTVGAKTAAYFDLSHCAFVEINETSDQAAVHHGWHRPDVSSLIGAYRQADFLKEEFIQLARAGQTIVVRDTETDPRTNPKSFAALGIASFVCVPLLSDGQWRFALCLYRSTPHDWRDDEVDLMRELTVRIWSRFERLRAEEAQREIDKRYRTLFDSIEDGFCTLEKVLGQEGEPPEFRLVEANPAFAAHSVAGSVIGKTIRQAFPESMDDWSLHYETVLRTGIPIRFESVLLQTQRVLEVCAYRIEEEAPRRIAVILKDITLRIASQLQLRESEERYRTLFDAMDEAFCIIEMIFDEKDRPVDYRFLLVNPAFAKHTGVPDAIGKRVRELVPDLEAHWFESFGRVALTGEAVRFENEAKDMDNRWFDIYACRAGQPGSRKVAVIFSDITARRLSDDILRKSEERYRYLFNSIDEGFCVIELIFDRDEKPIDYRFLEVNPSFEKQTGLHDAAGKRVLELAPTHETTWFERFGEVALTGEPIRFANEAKALNAWFDVYAFRVGEPQHRKVAVLFNNITERIRADQALRESAQAMIDLDRRKDEFLAMLSHELRNPLAPISNAVHLLRLQVNEDPLQQKARTIIERQVGQLTHIVDDLLEVSRINTGKVQLRQERIVISGIVERALEAVQPLIVKRKHQLTVAMPPQPIWLYADAARLEQVLVNLLTNAAKYTDEGGHIWLTVEHDGVATGAMAVLRVRDSGIGIDPELLPRIFDLFTQAQRSLDRSQGGLGIGLCLVQRLVDLHGGVVEAHSVLGQGSEFVVRLPLMPTSILASPSTSAEAAGPSAKGRRVLVVDDNVDAAQSLAMLLELSGHDVRLAYDGHSALDVALDYRPDAVLLDIGLPGLNGFEVAQRIRQNPALKHMLLVAMTGYGQDTDRTRSHAAGFDDHLVKPADFVKLPAILATVSVR